MGEGTGENFYTEWEESYESFDQMGLHENLLRGIYAYGTVVLDPPGQLCLPLLVGAYQYIAFHAWTLDSWEHKYCLLAGT